MSFLTAENRNYASALRYKSLVLKSKDHLLKKCILDSRQELYENRPKFRRNHHSPLDTLEIIAQYLNDLSQKSAAVTSNIEPPKKLPVSTKKDESKMTAAEQRYESLVVLTSSLLERIRVVENESAIDSLRLKIRVEINKKVGQISCLSSQVRKISSDLVMFFNECWRKYGHDFLIYCLYVFAQKVVDQAEKLLGIHVDSAYPYAVVVFSTMKEFSELEAMLGYVIYNRCPLAIPLHLNELENVARNPSMKELICFNENETLEEFLERNSGIIALLGAIFCMSGKLSILYLLADKCADSSIFCTNSCWMLMANYLNNPPTKISAHFLCLLIEVAGYSLDLHYKAHFGRVIACLKTKFIPKLPTDCAGIATRLDILVSLYFGNNPPSFSVPKALTELNL